jgi:hypothetical protein
VKRLLPLLILLLLPSTAWASRDQEATFQDDNELIYASPAKRKAALDTLSDLGVDRIRATVLWRAIAPDENSRTRPLIDTTNPDAYGDAAWRNLDDLVIEAGKRNIEINFNISGPSPLWANKKPPRDDIADTYEPNQGEWAQFVVAVGQRYSGDWTREDGVVIPRVDYWSIWNEPNHSGWLTPTFQNDGDGFYPRAASLYRALLDNAYAALSATGHKSDTILIGDTAPSGQDSKDVKRFMKPLVFVRALYCLDDKLARLKGKRAERLDCPKTGKEMVTEHPALFNATGYAHHPYGLLTAPTVKDSDPDRVTLATLNRLTRTLDTAQRRYGQRRKLPLYLTEFGYQTPPDFTGVSFKDQAKFINQAEYIAWKNPRVRTLSQFLLVDDDIKVKASFQTGLILRKGHKKKPSFDAYRMPLWLQGSGTSKRLFGVVRPAPPGKRVEAELQFRSQGGSWRTVRKLRTRGEHNWIAAKVSFPNTGFVRLTYGSNHSRTVAVP